MKRKTKKRTIWKSWELFSREEEEAFLNDSELLDCYLDNYNEDIDTYDKEQFEEYCRELHDEYYLDDFGDHGNLHYSKLKDVYCQHTVTEIKNKFTKKFGKKKARKLAAINDLKPIELNEAILLYNGEYAVRGGVPQSGDAYLKSTKHVVGVLLACIFTGLLTVTVVVTFTSDITFARVIYTIFKLGMLTFRMAKGYDRGAKAYNTIEVRRYKAKSYYLRLYEKFVKDKIYLRLGDKYGDYQIFMPGEEQGT